MYQTIDETKLYEASYYFKKRIASFLSTRRDARGSFANISAKGFQLHLWLFSLSRFVPSSLSMPLSSSFPRFLRIPTNSISFLCTSRFFATSLHAASVWVTTGAT